MAGGAKKLTVTPAELGKSAQKLAELSQQYEAIRKKLLQQSTTMGVAWQGPDNQAFVEKISNFCNELQNMTTKMDTASQAMTQQKDQYDQRRDGNTAAARQLPGG